MALSKIVKVERIEYFCESKVIQVRELSVISEKDSEISRAFHLHTLHPDSDISGESQEVQDVCNAVWSDEVKQAWAASKQEADSPE